MYQQRFSGHRNPGAPTCMDAAWMGGRSEHVISGSSDGSVCVWNAANGRLLCVLPSPEEGQLARCVQVSLGCWFWSLL